MSSSRIHVLALATLLAACTGAREEPAPGSEASGPEPYREPVVVFMEASLEEIETAREGRSEEDFAIIADDLMWYRATAHEFLEARGLPVDTLEGRRRLAFVVGGETRGYDFADAPTLDVIVLYEPGKEPLAIASVDVERAVEYFRGS